MQYYSGPILIQKADLSHVIHGTHGLALGPLVYDSLVTVTSCGEANSDYLIQIRIQVSIRYGHVSQ